MADTVTSQVLRDGPRNYSVRLTNISDGTGETNVVKVDKSTLVTGSGDEPSSLTLLRAEYSIQGFEAVKVSWDRTTDVTSLVMAGDDYRDFSAYGGMHDTGSGGNGDILISTIGTPAANDTYDVTLHFKKKG